MSNTALSIGRESSVDIKIPDITVSRIHAMMKLCSDGTLAILDCRSKFGTLKLVEEPIAIPNIDGEALYLQVGNCIMGFSVGFGIETY